MCRAHRSHSVTSLYAAEAEVEPAVGGEAARRCLAGRERTPFQPPDHPDRQPVRRRPVPLDTCAEPGTEPSRTRRGSGAQPVDGGCLGGRSDHPGGDGFRPAVRVRGHRGHQPVRPRGHQAGPPARPPGPRGNEPGNVGRRARGRGGAGRGSVGRFPAESLATSRYSMTTPWKCWTGCASATRPAVGHPGTRCTSGAMLLLVKLAPVKRREDQQPIRGDHNRCTGK